MANDQPALSVRIRPRVDEDGEPLAIAGHAGAALQVDGHADDADLLGEKLVVGIIPDWNA